MIYPKPLTKGYHIGVTATSDGNNKEIDFIRVDHATKQFNKLGYQVIETSNVRHSIKGRSSDAKTRAKEFTSLCENEEVRVIMAAGGGDYLVEMLSHLDFDIIKANPKWIQGYSDTTGLSFTITTNLDIATIYGENFGSFGMKDWHSSLRTNVDILEGRDVLWESFSKHQDGFRERITGVEGFLLNADVKWKNILSGKDSTKEIYMEGRTIGGCLDVLLNLVGTRFDKTKEFVSKYKDDGIIWFLESYDLGAEALTRGLWQLKESGWFDHSIGFIFGRPAMFSTYTDTNYKEAVLSVLGDLNCPIILDADIGHKGPQFAMINGSIAKIKSHMGKGDITFERR